MAITSWEGHGFQGAMPFGGFQGSIPRVPHDISGPAHTHSGAFCWKNRKKNAAF
ncbi:hypothetical protein NO263_07365 [Gluconacetobacter entanii]|uniref:Uncharacterized protein n=1 Tax=Gluconacetobacter entanii TaxID=108528 RepID=A0ABT3K4R6_9PROT|nr:hypothetical protein [Gluconacetobacter entanii]MCW4590395.1 hypothetical protein [Gluconacetobacter entanii]